ncbi:MAG: CAP domain-containing protein [Bacteroidia bacterium]|nr:CAP domain-containing protein [Bacteroidia bacterium]
MKYIILFFVLFCCINAFAQNDKEYPFDKWTSEIFEKANTAMNTEYMSETEKKVVFYCNLVRLNPKLFGKTYARKYIDSLNQKSTPYIKSLFQDLEKQKPLAPLTPAKDLSDEAARFAIESGTKGITGHGATSKRFKPFKKEYYTMGENCDYGNNKPMDIVMSLLIDEGVSDKGHRYNILNKEYQFIGVSNKPHKTEQYITVMDFGAKEASK